MKLVAIEREGIPAESIELSEIAKQMAEANAENYRRNGFQKPWCAYFAIVDHQLVGTCAFKSPLKDGAVEIAYFTFPGFEGRGYATQMAAKLVTLARATEPAVRVSAQTLPEENASTRILAKLKFNRIGGFDHPEDGPVWEWELS